LLVYFLRRDYFVTRLGVPVIVSLDRYEVLSATLWTSAIRLSESHVFVSCTACSNGVDKIWVDKLYRWQSLKGLHLSTVCGILKGRLTCKVCQYDRYSLQMRYPPSAHTWHKCRLCIINNFKDKNNKILFCFICIVYLSKMVSSKNRSSKVAPRNSSGSTFSFLSIICLEKTTATNHWNPTFPCIINI
jgi:hypothetical protein